MAFELAQERHQSVERTVATLDEVAGVARVSESTTVVGHVAVDGWSADRCSTQVRKAFELFFPLRAELYSSGMHLTTESHNSLLELAHHV